MKTKIPFVLFVVFSLLFTQLRAETIVADFSNKKLPATSWQREDADFTNSVYGEEAPALQLKAGGNLITGKVFNLNSISFNCGRNTSGTNFKVQYSTNLVDFVDIASYTKNDIEKYSSDVGMTHISLPDLSSIDSTNGIFIRFYSEKASYYIDDIVITYGEETPIVEQSEVPTFSVESGTKFGGEGLSVSLSAVDGATIYYNLNQTVDPTVDNAIVYDGNPIYLTSTTTIRAIAVEGDKQPSKSVVATYVYYEPGIESTALFHAENATELPDALYSYSLPTGQDSSTKSLCNRDDLIADNIMISFTKGVKDYTFSDGGKVRFYEESTLIVTPLNNVIIKSIQLRRKGEQGQYILLSGGGKIVDNSTAAGSINEWQGESDTRIMISNDGQIQFDYILVTYQQTQSESESIPATSITLDKTELSLEISQTAQLVATVLPENATDKLVTWKSSDESIAKVDANGVVTAVAVGETVITATTTDGSDLSASCKVKIQPKIIAESISLNNTEIYLKVAEAASLEASVLPESAANQTISWSTSDQAVATVNDKGLVTAVSVGEVTITATTTDGSDLSASCKVIVKSTSLKSITIDLAGHATAISCNPRQDYSFSIPWEEFFNVLNDVNIGLSGEDFYNVYDKESLKVIYSCGGNTIANGDVDAEFNPSLDMANSHAWSFAFNGNIDSEIFPLNIDETTTLDIHVICTPDDSKANIFPVVTVTTSLTFEPLKNSLAVMAARQETYWKDENTLRVFPTPYNAINPSTGKPFESCEYSFDIRQAFATENSLVNHSGSIKDCGSWDVMFASVDQPVGFYPTKNSKYQYANSYALSNNQIAMTVDWSDDNHIAWDETNHNHHNAYLNLRNNASGIELINHDEPVKLTFAARYPNGQIIPVDTFNLEIVKPLNFAALEIDECFVSSQEKSSIAVDSPFAISDYSGNKIKKNDKLYNYYGVKECVWHVDRAVVGVKPSGEFASASEVTKDSDGNGLPEIDTDNTMSLNDVPNADLSLTYENGDLTFINADRFDVSNEYYLVVPVTIEHKWGKAETVVVISVLPVVDRHLNFKMAEFNGYFIDGTLPGEDGSFIKAEDPLLIYDDNGDKIEKDSELYEFYGVQDFVWHVDKTAIGIKPTGAISSKEEVFLVADNGLYQVNESNTIMLSDMQSITISINYADGTLTYTNFGGLPVEKEFYLVVPVSVEYRWGKAETVVVIPVKPGTIIDSKADYIALDRTEVSLETSQTTILVATVLPESAADKSVAWTSSNEAVATVDANGMVTAIAVGEATITATTTDGSDLSASCKVTVVPVLAISIQLDKTEFDAMEITEFQLTATVLPENTTNKGVVWTSSDNEIASVDETGLVKMLRVGSVVITATTVDGSDLSASCHITIVVGIDDIEGDNVIVATIGDNIVVKNAQLGSNVRVYAADGSIITSEIATDGDVVIEAPVKGIYIVAIDGKSFKVMVK